MSRVDHDVVMHGERARLVHEIARMRAHLNGLEIGMRAGGPIGYEAAQAITTSAVAIAVQMRNDSPPTEQEGPMGRDDVVTVTQGELDALWKAVAERDEARKMRSAAESERDWLKKEIEPLRALRDDLGTKAAEHGILKGYRGSLGSGSFLSDLLIILDRYNLLPEAHEYE